MTDDNIGDDISKISQFHDGGFQILRLHNKWEACSSHREHGNLEEYDRVLQSIETELKWDAKRMDSNKNEKSDYVKKLDDLKYKILYCKIKRNRLKLYNLLIEKEELLREIKEKAGKGSKLKDSDEDDFD